MITVGMYKLAFIAAGGLLVAGALLGRATRGTPLRPEIATDEDGARLVGPSGRVHLIASDVEV
jgi:hypothetical protein